MYGSIRLDDATMARRVQWLKAIQEWQEEFVGSLSAREFVDCILADLLGQSVFVFTPSGDLLRLPKVSTAHGPLAIISVLFWLDVNSPLHLVSRCQHCWCWHSDEMRRPWWSLSLAADHAHSTV